MVAHKLKYYIELNGLRGIAALMVVFYHFMPDADAQTYRVIHLLHKVAVFGQTGVTLFFVLSGFLITRILLFTKQSAHYFAGFYIKRALRIFPLYYLGLVVFFFVMPLIMGAGGYGNNSWMYWIYLQNFADTFNWNAMGPQHFWSLAVEEHFYLFWPVIVYYSSKRNLVKYIAILIILAFVCRCILIHYGYGTFYFTFSVMDALAMGALLAWLEMEGKLDIINFDLLIIGSLILLIPTWLIAGGRGMNIIQIFKFPIISLFYTGIIGKLISKKTAMNKFFLFKPLNYTGKISYGLYVFHPLCFAVYYHYFPANNIWINAVVCLGASYAVASASFYLFELNFIKLKKYFEPMSWRNKQKLQFK